jgi:hypothetical protein
MLTYKRATFRIILQRSRRKMIHNPYLFPKTVYGYLRPDEELVINTVLGRPIPQFLQSLVNRGECGSHWTYFKDLSEKEIQMLTTR